MKNIIILSHEVQDYSNWRTKFDSDETPRNQNGIRTIDVLVDAQNEGKVTVLLEASDMDKFNAFVSSPRLKESMEEAGVISAPEIKILVSKN